MRRRSKKIAAIYRDTGGDRKNFLDGRFCCVCGSGADCVDEILRGKNRMRAFVERACWLPACGFCNTGPLADPGEWPVAKKLGLKLLIDPEGFDLPKVWETNAVDGDPNPPKFVTYEDVVYWTRNLLMEK